MRKANKGQEEDDPYFVQFVRNGKLWYGIIDWNSKEGNKALKAGYYRIKDAIIPAIFERKKDMITVTNGESYYKFIEKDFEAAKKNAEKIPFVHTLKVGHIFGVGVGDGTAWYIVTKVKGELCEISWRGWCPDRWISHLFGYGGEFRTKDIKNMVRLQEFSNKLYS
jgi:hypothetical protein